MAWPEYMYCAPVCGGSSHFLYHFITISSFGNGIVEDASPYHPCREAILLRMRHCHGSLHVHY
ncbi:MAG: hypothetical protein KBC33_03565 [Candidatus Pacebacteria bacterium]|nr:hypothetical protein [Candidatus Paceibacterota bacterium]